MKKAIPNNTNKAIFKELQSITHDEASLNQSKKKIKLIKYLIIIINFLAGCFIGSIYFIIGGVVFLIIGGVLILTGIPINYIFQRIEKNIEKYKQLC